MTTYTVPFAVNDTAYISDEYYCAAGQAVRCAVKGYSIWESGILARCFIPGFGLQEIKPERLSGTKADAIKRRKNGGD